MSEPSAPRRIGLPPVVDAASRLLILGSLPGERSLQQKSYYAHPRNHFWPLMSAVLGEALVDGSYAERLTVLARRHVALWDVVDSANREGSLDQKMRMVEVRDLPGFLARWTGIRAVAFNGKTAARLGRRALAGWTGELIDLPSSSPALTLPLAVKAEKWFALRPWVID